MADFTQFSVTPLAAASVNVPRFRIECQVVDSTTGALMQDYTGANAITFPNVLSSLSAADRRELVELVVAWLVNRVAGIG